MRAKPKSAKSPKTARAKTARTNKTPRTVKKPKADSHTPRTPPAKTVRKRAPRPFEAAPLLNVDIELGGAVQRVGRLAWQSRRILFEYTATFIERGLQISPFHLPLKAGVVSGNPAIFDGLMGVFNDSLPDGWGRLLLDRKLTQIGMIPGALTPIDRLAYVGVAGPGALSYQPEYERAPVVATIDLDTLAEDARNVLDGEPSAVLDTLLALGGSSGGARPKIFAACSADRTRLVTGTERLRAGYSHWLIKFRSSTDRPDVGAIEHAYSEMARAAGIDMTPTHLFPARTGAGYFGTERFDRRGNARVHVHSVCGLLDADFRIPSIGYVSLLNATRALTKNQLEVDRMFRRMVFNVLARNRDDHTKNHAFILEGDGTWHSTPAFDLTFSAGTGGEHALDIAGEGREPGLEHIMQVARLCGVRDGTARSCVDQVRDAVDRWPVHASASGVSRASAAEIDIQLNGPRSRAKPRR